MKTLLYAVLVFAFSAGVVAAQDVEDPPSVRFTGGVLTDLDEAFPIFELEADWPFSVAKVRGFGVARMGSITGQDISLDEPGSWASAQVTAGLHKVVRAQEFENASMRTSLCLFVGGKTPLNPGEDVVPKLAKYGGIGLLVRDLKSGSWGVFSWGIDEEGLVYVPPDQDLPEGYYGLGQIIAAAKLKVPNTKDIVWFGVEASVHISRNQYNENRDVLKAWVSVDPVAVLGKFVKE